MTSPAAAAGLPGLASGVLARFGSIRARLILGFALLLALLFAVAALPLQRLEELTTRTHDIVDRRAQLAILSQRANQHAQAAAIGLLNLMQTAEREARVPLYAAMDAELAAADRAVAGLEMAMLSRMVVSDPISAPISSRRPGGIAAW